MVAPLLILVESSPYRDLTKASYSRPFLDIFHFPVLGSLLEQSLFHGSQDSYGYFPCYLTPKLIAFLFPVFIVTFEAHSKRFSLIYTIFLDHNCDGHLLVLLFVSCVYISHVWAS